MGISLDKEIVREHFKEKGYELLEEYKNAKTPLPCKTKDGYYIMLSWQNLKSGKTGSIHSTSNPFTIKNINIKLKKLGYYEFECISNFNEYKNNKSILKFIHKSCGNIIYRKQCDVTNRVKENNNRRAIVCEHCDVKSLESTHASVLKQVWLHEKDGTVVEDRSCINPYTQHCLPTDIVNHNDKIAIEIQSWFHDFEDSKKRDAIKRKYWIDRGYSFYAIDQRDYTVLEMVQLFFPYIKGIPEYISVNFGKKLNDLKVQEMLNNGYNVSEISKCLNEPTHKIHDAVRYGRIEYPKNYQRADHTAVVQLDLMGKYINEFDSLIEAEQSNVGTTARLISSCLKSKKYRSGNYIWIPKKDYYLGEYEIPKFRGYRFHIPVEKYDLNNNFLKKYNSILEAVEDCGGSKQGYTAYKIYRAIKERKGIFKEYIWKEIKK